MVSYRINNLVPDNLFLIGARRLKFHETVHIQFVTCHSHVKQLWHPLQKNQNSMRELCKHIQQLNDVNGKCTLRQQDASELC